MQPQRQPVILQVLPSLISGGVERGTVEVTRALTKAGWKALIASSGGPMTPNVLHAGGEHIKLPLASKNPFRMWLNMLALEKIIKQRGVNIVHARSRAPAWSAYYAAKRCGVPFMTTFHGVYGLENTFKRKYNEIMLRGERVIAVSDFIRQHLKKNYSVPDKVIRVIHRGVDMNAFTPEKVHPTRISEIAQKWQLEALPVILFPGRIARWKGHEFFIEALAKLPHRRFIALMVGDDIGHEAYRESLEKKILSLKLGGHARFVGNTTFMAEAYTLAHVVVATSIEPEAFGRVVLEAQAMARPVIATNHGGACETVVDGRTGWLVPPGDVAALAATIDKVLKFSPEAYQAMGAAGQAQARRFTIDMMCEKTMGVYMELLSRKRPAAAQEPKQAQAF